MAGRFEGFAPFLALGKEDTKDTKGKKSTKKEQ